MVLALIAIAHIAQTDRTGHILQFAIAIGATGETIERMVGDVELHHAFAQTLQPIGLRVDHKTVHHRCGAGGRRAGTAFDFNQTHPA